MRRSLGDALKNAFEETIMKNVPIDQFQSLKCRNGAQNRNLREKLSKIGPFGNFDFWSKVNAKKSKSKSKSTGPESSQQLKFSRVRSGWSGSGRSGSTVSKVTWC